MAGKRRRSPPSENEEASKAEGAKKARSTAEPNRNERIMKAKRDNAEGVRIIMKSATCLDMTPLFAGYLRLKDTNELRARMAEIMEMESTKEWIKSKENGFGVIQKSSTTKWLMKTMIDLTRNPAHATQEDVTHGIPLDIHRWPYVEPQRGYTTWLVAIRLIADKFPDMFPGYAEKGAVEFLWALDPENWHRGYWVLRNVWREQTGARKNLKGAEGKTSKVQNQPAVDPDFFTDDDLRGVTDIESGLLTGNNKLLEDYITREQEDWEEARHEDDEESSPDDDSDSGDSSADAHAMMEFEASFRKVNTRLRDIYAEGQMTMLDDVARGRLLAHLGKRAQVLWPLEDEEGNDISDQTTLPWTQELGEKTVHEADVEGAVTDVDMEAGERQKFWELQRTINARTSNPAPYIQCCEDLRLPTADPIVGVLKLKPWQVTGVWWILWQWRTGLGSALLADDVGLGKTATALAALQLGTQKLTESVTDTAGESSSKNRSIADNLYITSPYTPTLIVCPAAAFDVWKQEIKNFPALHCHLWAGSPRTAELLDRGKTIETSIKALASFIKQWPTDDPYTARHVIITTYQTFHMRTVEFEDKGEGQVKWRGKGKAKAQVAKSEEDEDRDSDDDEPELDEESLKTMISKLPGAFKIIIADEAHKLKSIRTRTHQAVHLARATNILLISATPTINKPSDLFGSISLIWETLRPGLIAASAPENDSLQEIELSEYEEAMVKYEEDYKLTAVNLACITQFLTFLNPMRFRSIGNREKSMSTQTGSKLLPIILSIIQLRRFKGMEMDLGDSIITIGGDIPQYKVTTVELEADKAEMDKYLPSHLRIATGLHKTPAGFITTKTSMAMAEGKISMTAHRLLCHLTLHPALGNLTTKKMRSAKVLNLHEAKDYGYGIFHRMISNGPSHPIYRDRVSAALFISNESVKLQYMARIVYDVCYRQGSNLLIFVNWPGTQWIIELLLYIIGIDTLSIRSSHSRQQRSETLSHFNNPAHKRQVLVTSLKCGATSMNIQKNCSTVLFMEVPESANIAAQAIGRVHRLGQPLIQQIYIATTNHTYDQYQQSRAAKKMYSQLAGQSNLEVTPEDLESHRAELEDLIREGIVQLEAEDTTFDDKLRTMAEKEKVIRLYMSIFGQRSPRHEWDDPLRLEEKDHLESEGVSGQTIKRKLTTVNFKLRNSY
jgi:hypothetical protein